MQAICVCGGEEMLNRIRSEISDEVGCLVERAFVVQGFGKLPHRIGGLTLQSDAGLEDAQLIWHGKIVVGREHVQCRRLMKKSRTGVM